MRTVKIRFIPNTFPRQVSRKSAALELVVDGELTLHYRHPDNGIVLEGRPTGTDSGGRLILDQGKCHPLRRNGTLVTAERQAWRQMIRAGRRVTA